LLMTSERDPMFAAHSPLKFTRAILACAVVAVGIASPLSPASPFAASVASAQTPTPAPVVDPISKAKAVLVEPPPFVAGDLTTIDSVGSVGDVFEWRISPSSRPFLIGDGRKQAWTFRNARDPEASEPFAVTLLVYTKTKEGVITSVDSTVVIVRPHVAPNTPPPVVVTPDVPVEPEPDPETNESLRKLTALLRPDPASAALMCDFYTTMATQIRGDSVGKGLKTVGDLRGWQVREERAKFTGTAATKIVGVAAAIGGFLDAELGLNDIALDHAKAVNAFHRLSAACGRAAK